MVWAVNDKLIELTEDYRWEQGIYVNIIKNALKMDFVWKADP